MLRNIHARKKYEILSVNNTFRNYPSSKIKTSNATAKGLSRHQGGFAIDLNGVSTLNKKQLKNLNKIAAKYGFSPIKNQSKDLPHFSSDPKKHGYKNLSEAVKENYAHYDELTGNSNSDIETNAITDENNNVIGVQYKNTGNNVNSKEMRLLLFKLLYKYKK